MLLGRADEPVGVRRVRVQALLTVTLLLSDLLGVVTTVVLVVVVLPGPGLTEERFTTATWVVAPVYVLVATLAGGLWAGLGARRWLRWSAEARTPTDAERRATLRMPLRFTLVQAVLWFGGVAVITTAYALVDPGTAPRIGFTTGFSGLVVCCAVYLFTEFGLRPLAAAALAGERVEAPRTAGTMTRVRVLWALGNGVPVLGIVVLGLYQYVHPGVSVRQLAQAVMVLGATALGLGYLLSTLLAATVLGPVRTVRWAMNDLADGDLERRVAVFDGSELGDLQRGFNHMAEGLGERERLRDLFGRHVGREVALAAEAADPELGGSAARVAVLFVDVVGSTEIAERREPAEVVEMLNEFFEVVVAAAAEHGGLVDKFLGDAALVVFGRPAPLDDPAGAALACARGLARELRGRVGSVDAGVGVSYGDVVAGYVGAHSRFEYTVIGDAVNEASRLCELAKDRPGRVLASGSALEAAASAESRHWQVVGEQVVRGRRRPSRLAVPTAGYGSDGPVPA